ncbi:PepSY domain-containing protein [Hoeflea alexandrii]|uniref:PepSY domain-containing protein n=1 Tax=Hoeflea alexandrii TaxID=288436 RepID=UPI0022AEE901|nr:PepSY domain-containing protein [Hoeflea alexandrii]MCZ4288626.1 PepSY domain-containing protein [Hoeflea alexandrii]
MRKSLAILFLFTSLGATGLARAEDDDCAVPMAQWQPREAVQRVAAEQGVTVRRIKIDDGCYQIKGRDASGRKVEIKVNPQTLEVIEIEYDD